MAYSFSKKMYPDNSELLGKRWMMVGVVGKTPMLHNIGLSFPQTLKFQLFKKAHTHLVAGWCL